jgi:hypothetical protein
VEFHGFGEICCYHKANNAGETQAMTQRLVSIVSNCFGLLMRQCRGAGAGAAALGKSRLEMKKGLD